MPITLAESRDFTDNHELAAKALRIPLGTTGAIPSPYLALLDFLKRWPSKGGRRDRTAAGTSSPCLGITIKDDEPRSGSKWKCFSQLLHDP